MVHSVQDTGETWRNNTAITRIATPPREKPLAGERSPNKGYAFVVQGGRPSGRVTIDAEKDHFVEIRFSNLYGLSDVRWVNEKLVFMRPWWGRIAATDLIFDVEREQVIYAEPVTDGTLAHRQYLESCPIRGCECIGQRSKMSGQPTLERKPDTRR